MCNQSALNEITASVIQVARDSLGNKLEKVFLYGSYARGDYNDESDIDIMILANVSADVANRLDMELVSLTSQLGLKHDIMISLFVKDCETFYRYLPVEPFYQNVVRDGVLIGA